MAAVERRRLDFERCQNIALLSLLTQNPTSIETNTCASSVPSGKKGRVLSFERESHLAEALAFISGISDRPEDVVAICIEELSGGSRLSVLVAVNRSTHDNSNDERFLGKIKSGLEAVFRVLARAGTENDIVLEEQTLDAIIDLCRDRILSRIRSQRDDVAPSDKGGRPFSGSNLKNIICAVRRHLFHDSRLRSDAKLFIDQTERLLEAVNKVESSNRKQINVALKNLVVTACSLHRGRRAVKIEAILGDLTSKELNPSGAMWLKAFIKKLARYRECSGYLLRVSKKQAILRNATVMPVSLGKECFMPQDESPLNKSPEEQKQYLANCVSRCRKGADISERSNAQARAEALRGIGSDKFVKDLQTILKAKCIHAEVQIVAYYELHPATIQPRIIKSSKHACYLCNLFIKHHAKFHTPRTHGRLYPSWRLPSLEKLNPVQTELNKSLQARIWHVSLGYMQTKERKQLICVNESDVGSLSSMSSLGSFGLLTEKVDAVDKTTTGVKVKNKSAILPPKGKSVAGTSGPPLAKTDDADRKKNSSQISQSSQEDSKATIVQSALGVSVQKGPHTSQRLETIREVDHESPEIGRPSQVVEVEVLSLQTTIEETQAQADITQHSSLDALPQTQKIAEENEIKVEPTIQRSVNPEIAIEQTHPSPEESPHDVPPLSPNPHSNSNPNLTTSQISPPPRPQPAAKSEQDADEEQIFLTQGHLSTFRLGSHRRIPSYRTGKSGKFIIYPEFITSSSSSTREGNISTAITSSSPPSSSKGGGTIELRVTWLLPSQSQSHSQQRERKDREHTKNIPEYLIESLSTSEDTDTGSSDFVRLVSGGGDTVLIEVVR